VRGKNYLTYEQQMCRSYEYRLRIFNDQLELELWSYSKKVVQEKWRWFELWFRVRMPTWKWESESRYL